MNIPQTQKLDSIRQQKRDFLTHLRSSLENCQRAEKDVAKVKKDYEDTLENVKFLGSKVEHTSLIPLGKIVYVNGFIKHTGEYFLDKKSYPESYSVVETLDRTVGFLEEKVRAQSEALATCIRNKEQVEEKIQVMGGGGCGVSNNLSNDEQPKEIVSDRGVAVKVGEFYEILERED